MKEINKIGEMQSRLRSYKLLLDYIASPVGERLDASSILAQDLVRWGLVKNDGTLDHPGAKFALAVMDSPEPNMVFTSLPKESPARRLFEELLAPLAREGWDSLASTLRRGLRLSPKQSAGLVPRREPARAARPGRPDQDLAIRVATGRAVLALCQDNETGWMADFEEPRLINAAVTDAGQPKLILSIKPDLMPVRPLLESEDAMIFKAYQLISGANPEAAQELFPENKLRALRAWLTIRRKPFARLNGYLRVHFNARAVRIELYVPRPSTDVRQDFAAYALPKLPQGEGLAWPVPVKRSEACERLISVSWSYTPDRLPAPPDLAGEIVRFLALVWKGISGGLAQTLASARPTSAALGTFAELLALVGSESRRFTTLGGLAQFTARSHDGQLLIEKPGAAPLTVHEALFDRVSARYVACAAQGPEIRRQSSSYTDPKWVSCPNRIAAPYLPAIFEGL